MSGRRDLLDMRILCAFSPPKKEIYLVKFQFSNLFRIAYLRDATVQEVLSWNENQHYWDITFTRILNDWEEESILNLLSLLPDLNVDVHLESEDKIVWSHGSRGIFSVKLLRVFVRICLDLIVLTSR